MDKRDVRERIVEAAMRVFAREGFFNATTERVAREAGVSKGLVFWYFRRKDELIREVALRSLPLDVIRRCLRSGAKGGELLRLIAEEYLRKYSSEESRSLLLQALSIKSMYPALEEEVSRLCTSLLRETAERVYGRAGIDELVRMRVFLGALLCYILSRMEEVDADTYIFKVVELVLCPALKPA